MNWIYIKNNYKNKNINFLLLPVFWYLYFKRTSGARKPGVPARGAFISGLLTQTLHTFNLPTQSHVIRGTLGTAKLFFSYWKKKNFE